METATESFEDFEAEKLESYWHAEVGAKADLVAEHATGGKQALQVTFQSEKSRLRYRRSGLDGYGASYSRSLEVLGARFIFHNRFVLDVFNPAEKSVRLVVTFSKRPFVFTIKPGPNTVSIPSEEIAGGVYRMTQVTHGIRFSVQEAADTVLVLDSIRLERESVGPRMKEYAKCFDFGPADMVRPGFTAVGSRTGYESRRGHGWLEPNTEEEKGKLQTMESSGAVGLGDLIRDGVSDLSSPFLVDLADGKYRVHIAGGYHWGGIYELTPKDYDFVIRAEGEIKHIRLRTGDQAERVAKFYGHDLTRYGFDEDIWAKFGAPVYGPIVFDVEVTDSQMTVEFLTSPQPDKGLLNFMVIYPVQRAHEVEPELRRVWYDVRRRYNRVSYRMLEPALAVALKKSDLHEEYVKPHERAEKIGMLVARPEFSGKDFMVFARDHLEQVYPDTVPDPEEEITRLEVTGAPGEVVPVTFSVFALHGMEAVRLDMDPLKGPRDLEILPEDIEIDFVRYSRRMLAQRSKGDWQYMVVPWYLVRLRTLDIERYMSRRFWINVRLAHNLLPGKYTSLVRISTGARREAVLKLELEVLPFRLREPEGCEFGVVYFVQPFNPGDEPYGQSVRYKRTYRLPREHAESVQKSFGKLHRQEIGAMLNTLRNYGFDTLYAGDWLDDMREANMQLLHPMTLYDLAASRRAAKRRPREAGGRDTFVLVDEKSRRAYLRHLDSYTEDVIRSLRDEKLKVICGVPSQGITGIEDPAVARFLTGVFLWRTKAGGVVVGPARCSWGDPYHPFDGYGGEPGSLLVPSSRSWPEPNTSRILEEMREGIKDYRYLITLQRLIRAAPDTTEAKQAEQYLAHLQAELTGKLADYVETTGAGSWRAKTESAWKAENYSRLRRDVIMHILSLHDVMTEGPREDRAVPEWP